MSKKTLHDRLEIFFQELEEEQSSLDKEKIGAKKTTKPAKPTQLVKGTVPVKRMSREKRPAAIKPVTPEVGLPPARPVTTERLTGIGAPETRETGEPQISSLPATIPGSATLEPTYQSA